MRRTPILLATAIGAVLAATLGTASAQAGPTVQAPVVVGIADTDSRTFATASTADEHVRMAPPSTATTLQRWSLDLSSTTGTRVVNVGTRGCLGLSPVAPSPVGAAIVQAPCRNDAAELWQITRTGSVPVARFVHVRTGLCLTREAASPTPSARLFAQRCANTAEQAFRIVQG